MSPLVRSKTVFLRLVEGELQEGVECVGPSSSVSNVMLAETLATTAHAVVLLLPRGATSSGGGEGASVQLQRKGDTKLRVRGRAPGSGSQESGGASKSSKASALLEFEAPSIEQCARWWQARRCRTRCMCVLILLLYVCPHTTAICVSSYYCYMCVLILLCCIYVSAYYRIQVVAGVAGRASSGASGGGRRWKSVGGQRCNRGATEVQQCGHGRRWQRGCCASA
jgi:hypothetical protein